MQVQFIIEIRRKARRLDKQAWKKHRPTFLDSQADENSADPDQTPRNAASDLGLHCLSLNQQFSDISLGSKLIWSDIRPGMVRSWDVTKTRDEQGKLQATLNYRQQ